MKTKNTSTTTNTNPNTSTGSISTKILPHLSIPLCLSVFTLVYFLINWGVKL
ncbi:hypothetical protein [Ruficoccus sp. ZRK36]|uniref:hypothetical protein n=1 Tax=Ruficoccus sp. ZRK36 TaxID=2866311 RepID=UPI001C73AF1B|nr:hypothetical protein [Ruficoccus sp. ZRK36]QYY35681.1 hypothetical protein K0V07_15450 [Ruficoccus sp. ZRK36]